MSAALDPSFLPDMESVIDGLKNITLFAGMSSADLESLAAAAIARSYPKNTIVVAEGDRSDTLYFILAGRVKIFLCDEHAREMLLRTQGRGEYFGEMMLDYGVRSASVMTLEPSRFAVLPRDQFRDFLAHHPDTALALIHNLIRRTRSLTEAVGDLALLDVYGRVAKLLLSLAREEDGRLVVAERLTQQEIGERIGASREMVSRILKDLAAGGYVRFEGRRLVIQRKPPRRW